jgi:hypothetical protein
MSDCGRGLSAVPRMGIGVLKGTEGDGGARFVAPEIAAFRTRDHGGFIPQAKHGVNGLCALAVTGSKFEGTGFENEHIGHIHVAELAGGGSGVGKWKPPSALDKGEAVELLDGLLKPETMRFCTDDRLEGFGTSVIFAEDLRKPACHNVSEQNNNMNAKDIHRTHSGQRPSNRSQQSSFVGHHYQRNIFGAMSNTRSHSGDLGF